MTPRSPNGLPPLVPDKAATPSGRWVRIALAVSLAANLGIAGIVAGAMFREDGPMRGGNQVRDLGFGPFTEALSKHDRAELRRAFLTKMPDMQQGRRAVRDDLTALLARLRATPFDKEALRVAFERQTARNSERLALGQGLIFDLVVGMTDGDRQKFADRLEQSLEKGPKPHQEPVSP